MKKTIFLILAASVFCTSSTFCQNENITFIGDFENGVMAKIGVPNTWRDYAPGQPRQNEHRWKLDSTFVRQGRYSMRIELRPTDTSKSGASDRAEVKGMNSPSGHVEYINDKNNIQYIAFSVRVDTNWQSPVNPADSNAHSLIIQLKKDASIDGGHNLTTGPAFSFQVSDKFYVKTNTGLITNFQRKIYTLSNDTLRRGKWVDFVIKIKFAVDSTGEILVWRRDNYGTNKTFTNVLAVRHTNTLLYYFANSVKTVPKHILHYGLYTSRQPPPGVTNILWLDGFTMATTPEAAQINAFDSLVVDLPGDNFLCVPPQITDTVKNISCFGQNNGSISIGTAGGTGPFTFLWKHKGDTISGQHISSLVPGDYNLTLGALGGCTLVEKYTIVEPILLTCSIISRTNPTCENDSGSVTVSGIGGTPLYRYKMENGDGYHLQGTFSGLYARRNPYLIIVKDKNQCLTSIPVTMSISYDTCLKFSRTYSDKRGSISKNKTDGQIQIHAFPNPAATGFSLTIQSSDKQPVEIKVTDIYCREVYHATGRENQTYYFGEKFPPGVYLAEVIQGELTKSIKIVKSGG